MEEERAHFSTRSFFYLETLGREGDSFSLDDNTGSISPELEGTIHGFEDVDSLQEGINDDESLED